MRRATLAVLFVLLSGCVSSKTFVLEPVPPGSAFGHVALKPADATIKVDPAAQAEFESKLKDQLKKYVGADFAASPVPPAPPETPDLVIQYRFVLFDQGKGGTRVASAITNIAGSPVYGLGDGDVGVEVFYLKPDGTQIGHIVTDGPISGALASTSTGLDSAATSVAKYTKANFTCPLCGHIGPTNPKPQKVEGVKMMADAKGM